jgi:hypothetical protein
MELKVEFEVTVPDNVTPEQADEWLQYQLGARGGMPADNPLADTDLEARRVWVTSA